MEKCPQCGKEMGRIFGRPNTWFCRNCGSSLFKADSIDDMMKRLGGDNGARILGGGSLFKDYEYDGGGVGKIEQDGFRLPYAWKCGGKVYCMTSQGITIREGDDGRVLLEKFGR